MHVTRISSPAEFDRLETAWSELAGENPFRGWDWNFTWWRHYGQGAELFVLVVRDDEQAVIGIAPWFLRWSPVNGGVLRFLGSGEICSEYHTLLCAQGREDDVAAAVAHWLTDATCSLPEWVYGEDEHHWQLIDFSGIEASNVAVNALLRHLGQLGNQVYQRKAPSLWRLPLPATWEAYQAILSKSHRKQVRQLENRVLQTDRAKLHTANDRESFLRGLEVLIDLHQRRRIQLGEAGCFASPRFTAFHKEIAARLLHVGRLRLHWLELDGAPAAAEYHFSAGKVVYAYQAGVNPDLLEEEPGRLIGAATLKLAIEEGFGNFDFLRGDEPYKAHWRAEPRACVDCRVIPRYAAARLRHGAYLVGRRMKHLLSASLPRPLGVTATNENWTPFVTIE